MGISMRQATSNSDWKDGFLFVGNQLILDFLNTRPLQDEAFVELLPDFHALLRWFQAVELITRRQMVGFEKRWGTSDRARRTYEIARELREKLRKDILAWEGGGAVRRSTIEELNRLMAEHPMHVRLNTSNGELSKDVWFDPQQPEDLLAPLADSAATLFAE